MLVKPSQEQLQQARGAAERLRLEGTDVDHVGAALLYCMHRLDLLEKVLSTAEVYLQFGLTPHHHQELQRAVDNAREDREVTEIEDTRRP